MKSNRRSFLKFLGLAPLAPAAADLTAEALKKVPAKRLPPQPSEFGGTGDFVPAAFTIPPQPRGIGGLLSYPRAYGDFVVTGLYGPTYGTPPTPPRPEEVV